MHFLRLGFDPERQLIVARPGQDRLRFWVKSCRFSSVHNQSRPYRLYRADRLEVDLLLVDGKGGVLRRLRQDGRRAGRGDAQGGRRVPAVRVPVRRVLNLE